MICKLWNEFLGLKTHSAEWTLVWVLVAFISLEVGSYNTASYGDGSNQNGDSSLCRVLRNNKKSVLASFREKYAATNSYCDLSDHCANVTCSAEFSRGKVNAGLLLKLCEHDPALDYWVDLPGQWDEPWVHTFSSKDSNGTAQRVEIGNHNGTSNQTKPTKWFVKVIFSITHGRIQLNRGSNYVSIQSMLQICQSEAEDSCTNTTLLDFPRLPQNQICYFDDESSFAESGGNSPVSSSRSSRNAHAWNPEVLHQVTDDRARKFENGQPLPASPGDSCDTENIFYCGTGATCVMQPDGTGTCHCIVGYSVNATSGICVKLPPSPSPSPLAPIDPDSDSRSYSSAVGAIISIVILVAIAGGIYFGIKYNYFARIRHRIPVLRCWPFRRHQPWEDNIVTMEERF